ncbi:hypothetical protein BH11ACT8_BH11ACT8_26020 [soil metagenome]
MRSPALALAAALLSVGALSGCGVSDAQPAPGVAARVGDQTIRLTDVDGAVDDACSFFAEQAQPAFPRSFARQQFVTSLVQREAMSQLLADRGLDVPTDYAADLETQLGSVPADRREAFRTVSEATLYISAGEYAIGNAEFTDSGETPGTADLVTKRGAAALSTWIDDHDVTISPVFGLRIDQGEIVADTTGLAVPASDSSAVTMLDAQTATDAEVAAAAAALPADQVCGDQSAPPAQAAAPAG